MNNNSPSHEPECWHLINQYDRRRAYLLFATATDAEDMADYMEEVYELYCFDSFEEAMQFTRSEAISQWAKKSIWLLNMSQSKHTAKRNRRCETAT